jgi:hypothetical protein
VPTAAGCAALAAAKLAGSATAHSHPRAGPARRAARGCREDRPEDEVGIMRRRGAASRAHAASSTGRQLCPGASRRSRTWSCSAATGAGPRVRGPATQGCFSMSNNGAEGMYDVKRLTDIDQRPGEPFARGGLQPSHTPFAANVRARAVSSAVTKARTGRGARDNGRSAVRMSLLRLAQVRARARSLMCVLAD